MATAELMLSIGVIDKASAGLNKIAGGLGTIGKAVGGLAFGGAIVGAGALSAALVNGIGDAREANLIMAQTEAVIKSTGGAAGFTADQIAEMAGSLSAASGKSLFGDDDIQRGQNMLLTFTNISEKLPDATQTMLDMATAMGTDAEAGAIQLGKALNDPMEGISALTRVGVTFTDAQKEQIKTMQEAGDMAGAQTVILNELNKEFGGSAEAAAKADGGWSQLKDRMGEMAESVGASLLPALNDVAGGLNSMMTAFEEGGLAGLWEMVGPKLLEFANNVGTWITEQGPVWAAKLVEWGKAFWQWVVEAGPPLIEKLAAFGQSMLDWVVARLPGWIEKLKELAEALIAWVAPMIPPLLEKLGQVISRMLNWVVESLPGWAAKLAEMGKKLIDWVLDALPGLMANLGTLAGKMLAWLAQLIIDLVPKIAEMAVKFVQWVITDVLPALPGTLAKIWDALVIFVNNMTKDAGPKLKELAQKFLDWVTDSVLPFIGAKLGEIKDAIITWIAGVVAWAGGALWDIGAALVQGLIDGINAKIDQARAALNTVIDIINSIPAVPNIPNIPGGSSGTSGGSGFGGGTVGKSFQPMPLAGIGGHSGGSVMTNNIVINQLPGEDTRILAGRVADEIDRRNRLARTR